MSDETYETFIQRCEVFLPHADCVLLSIVYKLAKFSHRHDVRKDERDANGDPLRYFEHLRRVALILMDVGIVDRTTLAVALLHDSVEDTRLHAEEIALVCGDEVSRRVLLASKTPKEGFRERLTRFGDWKVLCVKLADRIDNLRSMRNSTLEFQEKQCKETMEMYLTLADIAVQRAPDEYKEKVRELASLLGVVLNSAQGNVSAGRRRRNMMEQGQ